MVDINKKLGVTELVLRDGHQSLFATRMRIDDMLPIAAKLDQVGYWSLETWGGATFDACIRYLGEDPWDRIRELKAAMPKTPQQMLLRGQNLLGYRHYADDVVNKFVERCAINGVDVFRIFDAMNDSRNLETAIQAVKRCGKHAQGTISYTTSPVHTLSMWIDFAKKLEDMQVDSIAIKDMSGILRPYEAYELVKALKAQTNLEVQLHAHATSGIADMTLLKAIEAGVDRVDTSISSMSMTYGHTATETVVASLQGQPRDTGLDITLLEDIAAYFREVRKKYAKFEGSLRGTDSRILIAQVPGGMLTNMESQLKEQGAADRFDEVLAEIPKVRKDLGYIPLVTPTSQIVGTQAVINTLMGERYKSISKEVQSILKGEYGRAPAEFDADLQQKVLNGEKAITCRPADLLSAEFEQLQLELKKLAEEKNITLAKGECEVDDVLSYALFPQVGLKFLENRGNANAFEAVPTAADSKDLNTSEQASKIVAKEANQVYTVKVNGQNYVVEVSEGGDVTSFSEQADRAKDAGVSQPSSGVASNQSQGESIAAPLAGNIWKVMVATGQQIKAGDVLVILEAMKMETEVRAYKDGCILTVDVKEGDTVQVGDSLVTLA